MLLENTIKKFSIYRHKKIQGKKIRSWRSLEKFYFCFKGCKPLQKVFERKNILEYMAI